MDWIKCTDRMPPKTMIVMVTIGGENFRPFVFPAARWNENKQYFERIYHAGRNANPGEPDSWWGKITARVTHWMPMPKPAED